jgi:cell division protein FtsL
MSRASRRPLYVYAVAVVIAIAGAYLSFELGRVRAGYSIIDHRREIADWERRLREQTAEADELRSQLAILKTGREIDDETYSQVKANLSDLQARIQAQEEELVFYRGIVSPQDGVAGLRIQSLDALPADGERRYLLRIVLVQAIVHSRRVGGAVKLQLEGLREGQMASLDVADLVADGDDYDMAYQFRYFQGLECEIVLPVGFEPQRLAVEIVPSEQRAEHQSQSFEWAEIAR